MVDVMDGRRVLVVDDAERFRELYRRRLLRIQCQVALASSKEEVLEHLANEKPALVLLDVFVPTKEDGYDICRSIKNGQLRPDVQVVMITAVDDSPSVLAGCLQAGADDFLSKTASEEEFLARVGGKLRAQSYYLELIQAERRAAVEHAARSLVQEVAGALALPSYMLDRIKRFTVAATELVEDAEAFLQPSLEALNAAEEQARMLGEFAQAQGEPVPVAVAVRSLLEEAQRLTQHLVARRGCRTTCRCPKQFSAEIHVWRPGLLLAMMELISNAATLIGEYAGSRGRAADGVIELSAVTDNGRVLITTTDNGPGVDAEMECCIYQRGSTSRRHLGYAGNGLWFVKLCAESAGGSVRHEPADSGGTKFTIELPLRS